MTFSDGAERFHRNRAAGIVDRAVRLPRDPVTNDAMAKAAEDFFADAYGLPRSDNRGPKDAEFQIGPASIDVKWAPRPDSALIHWMGSRGRCTAYILVVGDTPDQFRIVGWAWGKDLHDSVRDLGHGPTYVLYQNELRTNVDILLAAFLGSGEQRG